MTPDYQRKEVAFESQLAEIIEREDLKDYIKEQNSIKYVPPNVDVFTGEIHTYKTPTMQEKAYLMSNSYEDFKPQYEFINVDVVVAEIFKSRHVFALKIIYPV